MTAQKNLYWWIGESIYEDWQFGARTEFVNNVNTVVTGTEFDFTGYTAEIHVRSSVDSDTVLVTLESPTTILTSGFASGIIRVRGGATLLDAVTPGTYVYDLKMTSASRTLFPLRGQVVIQRPITR